MAALMILNIARVHMKKAKKTYSTRQSVQPGSKLARHFHSARRWRCHAASCCGRAFLERGLGTHLPALPSRIRIVAMDFQS